MHGGTPNGNKSQTGNAVTVVTNPSAKEENIEALPDLIFQLLDIINFMQLILAVSVKFKLERYEEKND